MSIELVKVDKNEVKESNSNNIICVDTATKSIVEVTRNLAVIRESSELLKCSVSIADLTAAKDGSGLLGMIQGENGKIKTQARFNPADLKSCLTPAILYNVASIALGQKFMYEIKNELNNINKKLDEIIQNFKDEKIASINAMMSELEYINNTKNKSFEDAIMLRNLALKAEEIRQYTKIKLNCCGKNEEEEYFEIYKSAEKINEYSYFLLWQYYLQKQDDELVTESRNKFFCVNEYLQKEYKMLEKVKKLDSNKRLLKYLGKKDDEMKSLYENFNEKYASICERKNLLELTTEYYLAIK